MKPVANKSVNMLNWLSLKYPWIATASKQFFC